MPSRFPRLIPALLLVATCGCASLGRFSPLLPVERALLFYPSRFPERAAPPTSQVEDAEFMTSDGLKLHGWYFDHPQPKAVVLFCHGNAGCVVDCAAEALRFNRRHQVALLLFDYRGYGRSEGQPSEAGILADGRAARDWLAQRTGVNPRDIVLMGRSLGGAVAVDLAADDGARGLVLESTFSSLPDVAGRHYPLLLPRWNMVYRLDSADKIRRYSGPLLQSHGDRDSVIPIELGRKLFAAARGPKRFVVIPGADHNDPQSEEYRVALDEFLAALPAVDAALER